MIIQNLKEKGLNLLVSLLSFLLTFIALESAARIYKGEYVLENYLEMYINLFHAAYPVQYDSTLGWIPEPNTVSNDNVWETSVTLLDYGIRSNGEGNLISEATDNGAPILVVGDSFTFGDQASDHETWPAILERLLHKKVLNAGVFGYGIDQAFLRARTLIEIYKPGILIFSFVPDDVFRCELSERTGVKKPYFEVSNDSLQLMNIPVPQPAKKKLTSIRRVLGYSFLVHKIMMRAFPDFWLQGLWFDTRVHSHGAKIACLILKQLSDIVRSTNTVVYVLAQYNENEAPESVKMVEGLLNCIQDKSINVVDLKNALEQERAQNPEKHASYFRGHMTYEGNYFVALQLQKALQERDEIIQLPD